MKKVFKTQRIWAIILIGLLTVSCKLDDGINTIPIPDTDIVEVADANSDLSSLVAALQRADLATTLKGSGPFTVFAPTNDAFSSFLSTNGFANLEAVPTNILTQVLLNHVISGRVDSALLTNLQRNYLQTLADGPGGSKLSLYFDAVDGVTLNGSSSVSKSEVVARNGIIHIVDQVIGLPTLDTFINTDDNFEVFGTALDVITPLSDIPNAIKENSEGPYTVFIPSEQAFDNLLGTDTNWNFVSDIEENLLTAVVEHHFLNGNVRSTSIVVDEMQTTIEGDEITFKSLDGNLEITDGSGNEGAIIGITDIQAINGVIHVIPNNVLIPDTTN